MFSRLTILQKGLLLILAPLLVQAVFAGVLLWRLAYRNRVENWAIHTKEVIAQAETVFRVLVEADSEVNAFAMIREKRVGESFEHRLAGLPEQVAKLGALIGDNPVQVDRWQAIHRKVNRFVGEMRDLYAAAQAGNPADAAPARLRSITNEDLIADIRKDLDGFLADETSLDRARLATLHRTQVQQAWILSAGMSTLLLVGCICAWIFGRKIVGRLNLLNDNVRRLTRGEALVSRVGGTDEIAVLDESFHRMAEGLTAASEKVKHFQESLERRADELAIMNRELSQKSEENEMFVYSVSHDLRSPLVNLQGFSKELTFAMREMRGVFQNDAMPAASRADGEEIMKTGMDEPVSFILTAVTRLSAIIDALLRLSRAGRIEYQRKDTDVCAIVQRVIDAMRSVSDEKKARVSIAGELPHVWGDPTAIEQIFANLVGNALNYLDKNRPGVIEVGVSRRDAELGQVTCYVKDNGLGIPEAHLGKIFGIFQRVHGNVAVGEGIGLALVRRMVERHGGRIWVESIDGVGSTFFVALPEVTELPAVPEAVAATASSAEGNDLSATD